MARVKRKREEVQKVKDSIQEEREEIAKSLPPIVRDTGGSIAGLGNKQPHFKKWVAKLQKEVNPLIGKDYIRSADEYNTDQQMVGDASVEEMTPEMMEMINQGKDEFQSNVLNPDHNSTVRDFLNDEDDAATTTVDTAEALKDGADDAEMDFIDITIVENLTKELNDQITEDIEKEAKEKLKEYHQNKDYEANIDIPEVIENYKFLLIEQTKKNGGLLE